MSCAAAVVLSSLIGCCNDWRPRAAPAAIGHGRLRRRRDSVPPEVRRQDCWREAARSCEGVMVANPPAVEPGDPGFSLRVRVRRPVSARPSLHPGLDSVRGPRRFRVRVPPEVRRQDCWREAARSCEGVMVANPPAVEPGDPGFSLRVRVRRPVSARPSLHPGLDSVRGPRRFRVRVPPEVRRQDCWREAARSGEGHPGRFRGCTGMEGDVLRSLADRVQPRVKRREGATMTRSPGAERELGVARVRPLPE